MFCTQPRQAAEKNVLIVVYCQVNSTEFKVMVFNATFNNISVISWQSVLLVEETTDLMH
jgi:hypothetical protein